MDNTNSNTFTPTLPMEIISNILLRLPPKPLARFKSVSKPFNTLISSRKFILSHILHSLSSIPNNDNTVHLSFFSKSILSILTIHPPTPNHFSFSEPIIPITLPYTHTSQDADLIGSCHGILATSDYPTSLSLFNPTTRTIRVIALTPDPKVKPDSHWVDFGFGRDPLSDSYKIVRVDQLNGHSATPPPRYVTVFTVTGNGKPSHGKWRKITQKFPHFLTHPKGNGQFLQDSLFFMSSANPPAIYDVFGKMRKRGQADKTVYKYVIVKFHLGEEKFTDLEMPVYGKRKKIFPKPTLAVLRGKLAVQIEHGAEGDRTVELWVRKEREWVKLCSFEFQKEMPGCIRAKPVGMVGDVVLMEMVGIGLMMMDMSKAYYWYNLRNGEINEVVIDGHLLRRFAWVGGHACDFGGIEFAESLVNLDNSGLVFTEDDYENNCGTDLGRMGKFITSRGWMEAGGNYRVPVVGII